MGADVSQFQTHIDFASLSRRGVKFVYIKAGGPTSLNPLLETQASAAKDANIKVGFYYLFDPRSGASEQFAQFSNILGNNQWELPPAIDTGDLIGSAARSENLVDYTNKFSQLVEDKFHVRPLLYVGISQPHPSGFSLWVPRYNLGANPPPDYLIWQFTDRGVAGDPVLSGISLDLLKGSIDELVSLGRSQR